MGKVNITLPNGRVVAADEEDARAINEAVGLGSRTATPVEEVRQREADTAAEIRHKVYGGVLGGIESAAGGVLDTLTLGVGTTALDYISPGTKESYQAAVAEHPTLNTAVAIGGMFVPGTGEIALARGVGRTAARAVGLGTRTARLTEGAVLGAAGTIAHASAVGDDLTTEALLEGSAIGGVLNYGMGALGDRLIGAGQKAGKAVEARRAADTAEDLFSRESPAYNELRDARDGARRAAMADFRDEALASSKYDAYVGDPLRMEKVGDGIQDAINDLRAHRMEAFGADTLGISDAEKRVMATIQAAEQRLTTGRTLLRGGDARGADLAFRGAAEMLTSESPIPLAKRIPVMPEIPTGTPVPPLDVRLPSGLAEFASMSPTKVAEFATHLADYSSATSSEVEALQKLAGELGVEVKDAPGELLNDVHSALRRHASALETLEESGAGGRGPLLKVARWAARRTAGAYVGSKVGSMLGPAGATVGGVVGGAIMGDVFTSTVMGARSGLRSRVQELVAKWAPRAGKAVRAVAPVTTELAVSFPSGRRDKGDLMELAARRANELRTAATTAPDALYAAVQPVAGMNGQVALAVHQKALAAIQGAAQAAPRDSGLVPRNGASDWRPSPTEAVALAYRLEALRDPMKAIERALSGDVHPDAVDALRTSWPAITGLVAEELAGHAMGTNSGGASALLGGPLFGLDDPMATLSLQGMYMRAAGAPQSPSPTPSALGRPPKVGPSKVAGSNVGALISQ